MPVTTNQRDEILQLLADGRSTLEVADLVGLAPGTVKAIRAHVTMGSYADEQSSSQDITDQIDAVELTFGLERDIQLALRQNIAQLEAGLVIADDGKERATAGGRIDILARDATGTTVVIELKAGEARPEVVAQTLAYIGALREEGIQSVRGIIVASAFPQRVILAAAAVPALKLISYSFQFSFSGPKTTGKL